MILVYISQIRINNEEIEYYSIPSGSSKSLERENSSLSNFSISKLQPDTEISMEGSKSMQKENSSLSNFNISTTENESVEFGQNATRMAMNKSLSIQEHFNP